MIYSVLLLNYIDYMKLQKLSYSPYARSLGLKKDSSYILRSVAEKEQIPLVTKIADARTQLSTDALHFLNQDIYAAELYNQVVFRKTKKKIPSDYFYQFPIL